MFGKQVCESGRLFLRKIPFPELVSFFHCFREALLPTCVYRSWDLFRFLVKIQENIVRHKSSLCVVVFLSFSFYFFIWQVEDGVCPLFPLPAAPFPIFRACCGSYFFEDTKSTRNGRSLYECLLFVFSSRPEPIGDQNDVQSWPMG